MNELADNLLYNTAQQPAKHRENRVFTSTDDENTFVVRFSTTFASDSDPEYLKKNYQDFFMFGRVDFGEEAFGRLTSEVMQLAGQYNSLAP
jgi:hypothetical protein